MAALGQVATGIGVINDAVSLFSTVFSDFLPKPDIHVSTVRVHAGLARNGDSQRSTGGDVPDIDLWDASGSWIGYDLGISSSTSARLQISDGGFHDFSVQGTRGDNDFRPPEYISVVTGGNDGLCITAIAVTTPDGDTMNWFGDIGYACGAPWYAQNKVMGTDTYRPKCIWIDGNGDSGHKYRGLGIHLRSFTKDASAGVNFTSQWQRNPDLMCKSEPRFSMYEDIMRESAIKVFKSPPKVAPDGTDNDIQQILNPDAWAAAEKPFDPEGKCENDDPCLATGASASGQIQRQGETRRRGRYRRKWTAHRRRQGYSPDQLIISNLTGTDARDLCTSYTSDGPDYASLTEGLFCDMSEKQLWPLCSADVTTSCFDVGSQNMRDWRGNLASVQNQTAYDNTTASVGTRSASSFIRRQDAVAAMAVPPKSYGTVRTWG